MKLTLKIKLLSTKEQADLLVKTIKEANTVCNTISEAAWEKKVFNPFKIHNEVYHSLKGSANISAQVLVRCISKIAEAYKLDRKGKHTFKPLGSITYDSHILSYKPNNIVSIWSVGRRFTFLEYEAALNGVKLVVVEPAYTSKTCCICHHIGNRNNKSFTCNNCGNDMDADVNASLNIATPGRVVNHAGESDMYSCSVHYLGSKPIPSALAVGG